jgi:outer membrane lipoprotein-sorting protein
MALLRPRWLILNKKSILQKGILPVLVLLLVLLVVFWAAGQFKNRGAGKIPADEMLSIGLERTRASASYRYQAETKLIAEGQDNTVFFSQVTGEIVAPADIHMVGTMMNTPIEFIQAGDNSYFKDQSSGKWIPLPGNKLADSELFYAELNPMAYFNFKDVTGLKHTGTEKVNGEELLVLELRPNLIDPFLELRLTDYRYKLWLDPRDYRLRQAALKAKDKQTPGGEVDINLRLWDYDQVPPINPPS